MQKPQKTFADYLVIAISPVLIMLLVGSLAFFLIQVFYRGEMIHGIRWVMFWFVLAIVLVSRIGIEQSKEHAIGYGAALAIAMWVYLAFERAMPVFGVMLLAVTWWCAHRLTVDCTLINDDQDASGEGVLQSLLRKVEQSVAPPSLPPPKSKILPIDLLVAENLAKRPKRVKAPTPGRWVIYFSIAALPLFGLGQLLLPADNPQARRAGFEFLAIYLGAALSLLMTTSFLGLRRYLRQRSVEMSTSIALGWVRFGVILSGLVLISAMLLPRPGALNTWKTLTYQISHKTHKASDHALPFNPPGEGDGTPANEQKNSDQSVKHSAENGSASGSQATHENGRSQSPDNQPEKPNQSAGSGKAGGKDGTGEGTEPGERADSKKTAAKDNSSSGSSDGQGQSGGGNGSGDGNGKAAGKDQQAENDNPAPKHNKAADDSEPKNTAEKKQTPATPEPTPPERPKGGGGSEPRRTNYEVWLRVILILALLALFIWAVIRYRKAIAQAMRAFIAAVREFFQKLFNRRPKAPKAEETPLLPPLVLEPFAAYENPFLTGKDKVWPPERLVLYTYGAVQAWAKEHGIEVEPQETPREFCNRLSERFPEFGPELERFSYFYAHAAFAEQLPEDFEDEPVRRLWQDLGETVMAVSTHNQ